MITGRRFASFTTKIVWKVWSELFSADTKGSEAREKRGLSRRRRRRGKKALLWSVTGIAASSFTLDLIQPLQDKAVNTIPFLLRYSQHKEMIEVNRRCKTAFLMVRRLELTSCGSGTLSERLGWGEFRCSYLSDLLKFQLCGLSWENVGKRAIGKNVRYVTCWRRPPKHPFVANEADCIDVSAFWCVLIKTWHSTSVCFTLTSPC
jgi:hypothetical protein